MAELVVSIIRGVEPSGDQVKFKSSFLLSHRFLVLLLAGITLTLSYFPLSRFLDDSLYQVYRAVVSAQQLTVATRIIDINELRAAPQSIVAQEQIAAVLAALKRAGVSGVGFSFVLMAQDAVVDSLKLSQSLKHLSATQTQAVLAAIQNSSPDRRLAEQLAALPASVVAANWSITGWQAANIESLQALSTTDSQLSTLQRLQYGLYRPPSLPGQVTAMPGVARNSVIGLIDPQPVGQTPAVTLAYEVDGQWYPSVVLQLYLRSIGLRQQQLSWSPQGLTAGKKFVVTAADLRVLPHALEDAAKQSRHIATAELLAGKVPSTLLNKRWVIITDSQQYQAADAVRLAQSLDVLLAGEYFQQPAWLYAAQRGVIVFLALTLVLWPSRFRDTACLASCLIIMLLLLNISLLLTVTQNIWLPLALPAAFVLVCALVLPARHRLVTAMAAVRQQAARAYRDLAQNYQSQGQLDIAYEYLAKCPTAEIMLEPLYNLAMDYERRRQFSKALSVYTMLADQRPGFRDIKERSQRLSTMPEAFPTGNHTATVNSAATVILDDAAIAKPVLGRYQIERELGHGAMGMVYLGKDPKISRTVAIKTLALASEFEDARLAEVKQRFYREAETAGKLNHPNIVTIYDVGEEHDLAYIAMDYIEGSSLEKFVQPATLLTLAEVFAVGIKVAEALEYAHHHGVVHRDVKPANIIYNKQSRVLKIMDFGIACLTDNSKTRTGTVLGSPFYMSPEQIAGKRVDGRADIYSLGVTLYQLLTGSLPFDGDSLATLMYKITHDKAVSIRKLRSDLPSCLARIIKRAMAKSADERFQSAAEMVEALRACGEKQGLTAKIGAYR